MGAGGRRNCHHVSMAAGEGSSYTVAPAPSPDSRSRNSTLPWTRTTRSGRSGWLDGSRAGGRADGSAEVAAAARD